MEQVQKLNKNRTVEKNQATRFLLPLVYASTNNKYPVYLKDGFENCYLYSDDKIVLIYNITDDIKNLDEDFNQEELFVDSIDVGNEQKVGYIFEIPEQYKEDVEKFKKGLYSQFSDDYKEQILTFWDIEKTENVFEGILYKTEIGKKFAEEENNSDDEKAEGEYWPKPNMEIEQFSNMY